MNQNRLKIALFFGGRSSEHEVSLRSAAAVFSRLDRTRFEVYPVGIDKSGRWRWIDAQRFENLKGSSLFIPEDAPEVVLPPYPQKNQRFLVELGGAGLEHAFDVLFPVMHGPLCEDGSIQGLFELASVPYVGCSVLASSMGMDKDVAKRLVQAAGLPIVPYISIKQSIYKKNPRLLADQVARELGFPVFVKPANLGSSVGVHKVREASALSAALDDAFSYDPKVLVERAVSAREIEMSVLENADSAASPLVSVPGEIATTHEFYSYESKYLDDHGAKEMIPAQLTGDQVAVAQKIGREAFQALECEGMARVDLFLDRDSGKFYFNELNTLPGFTSISMYPKMWEASGIGYSELLSKLVDLAVARHKCKSGLVREFRG